MGHESGDLCSRYVRGVLICNMTEFEYGRLKSALNDYPNLTQAIPHFFGNNGAVTFDSESTTFSSKKGTLKYVPFEQHKSMETFIWTSSEDRSCTKHYRYSKHKRDHFYLVGRQFTLDRAIKAVVKLNISDRGEELTSFIVYYSENEFATVKVKNVGDVDDKTAKTIIVNICRSIKGSVSFEEVKKLYQGLSKYIDVSYYFYAGYEKDGKSYYVEYIHSLLRCCCAKMKNYLISFDESDAGGYYIKNRKDDSYVRLDIRDGKEHMSYYGSPRNPGKKIDTFKKLFKEFKVKYGKIS